MAVINTSEIPQASGRPMLPKAVRSLRVISIEKKVSKNGFDMFSYGVEFCYPESEKLQSGEVVKLAGMAFNGQIVFHGKNDMPGQEMKQWVIGCKANPLVDLDNPAFLRENFLGKGIRAEVKTETSPLVQVDPNTGNNVPVLDDAGNPVIDNQYRITRVIGSDDRFTVPASAIAF